MMSPRTLAASVAIASLSIRFIVLTAGCSSISSLLSC
jgi:hypothetical protein